MGSLSGASRDRLLIGLILSLALLHGLIYVFTVPPWEHYDEPNHFEYVWLTANLDRLPTEADYSPKLSRMVVRSMIENGFYEHRPNKPVVGPTSEKLVVPGYSQLGESPGYYVLASLPLQLLSSSSIDVQLYSARLVSILFLLITVVAGWGIAYELTGPGHPLRWILPASIALTPAFVDLMSAVNNDAAAVGIASLFLWSAVRLVRRGFSRLDFLLLLFLGGLTFSIKITAVLILAILPLVLLFVLFRGRARKAAWLILLLGSVAFLLTSIRIDDAFAWFRNTSQPEPTRQQNLLAPAGRYVLAVQPGEEVTPPFFPEIFQHHPISVGKNLAGKQVTFGYWIWSDRQQQVKSPELRLTGASYSELLNLTLEPKFYAFQIKLPENTSRIWINLSPGSDQRGSHIYYDGLVLVEGSRPTNEISSFNTTSGDHGVWAGEPFKNILRNGSAEIPGLRFNPWLDNFAAHYLPDGGRPSLLIASLLDSYSTSDLYPTTAIHLFQTFWAKFGWGQIPIIGNAAIYQILWFFTLLGFIGALLGVFRKPRSIPWDCVIILASISVFYFLMALTRGGIYLANYGYYFSVARYFYPTIIPFMMVILFGWLEWIQMGKTLIRSRSIREANSDFPAPNDLKFESGSKVPYVLFLGFFLVLDVLSIISIYQYYY